MAKLSFHAAREYGPGTLDARAVRLSLERCGLKVCSTAETSVSARAGVSWIGWGELVTVWLTPSDRCTRLDVESVTRWILAAFDNGKNERNVRRFLAALDRQLPAVGWRKLVFCQACGYRGWTSPLTACPECGCTQWNDHWDTGATRSAGRVMVTRALIAACVLYLLFAVMDATRFERYIPGGLYHGFPGVLRLVALSFAVAAMSMVAHWFHRRSARGDDA